MTPAAAPHSDATTDIGVQRTWRRNPLVWLGALGAYWVALFTSTHVPDTTVAGAVLDYDKLAHAGAYGVLATLVFVAWRRTGARPGLGGRLLLASIVLAYGVVDEMTQPYVGRQCELADWLADALGVGLAVVLDQWRHRRRP